MLGHNEVRSLPMTEPLSLNSEKNSEIKHTLTTDGIHAGNEYGKETLSVEFKSDTKSLPDTDILEAMVMLANTDGGTVYLGVEDNGTPTGLHQNTTVIRLN